KRGACLSHPLRLARECGPDIVADCRFIVSPQNIRPGGMADRPDRPESLDSEVVRDTVLACGGHQREDLRITTGFPNGNGEPVCCMGAECKGGGGSPNRFEGDIPDPDLLDLLCSDPLD